MSVPVRAELQLGGCAPSIALVLDSGYIVESSLPDEMSSSAFPESPPKSYCNLVPLSRLSDLWSLPMDRRSFLKSAAATTVITSLNKKFAHAADASIPTRTLGRSGEKVSIVGLGGYHLGMQSDEQ